MIPYDCTDNICISSFFLVLYRSTLIEIVRRSSPNRDPDDLQTAFLTNRCPIVVFRVIVL